MLNRTYLDVETTGLDPYRHEIIEIAFVVEAIPENPLVAGKILDKWVSKVKPLHLGQKENAGSLIAPRRILVSTPRRRQVQ